jgi:hypothetical protein
MSKKVSYKNLLKQAISEYDTSKTVQVKGPMLDPILSWDGDGELPIYKDAASILERYYFNENAEEPVMVSGLEEDDDLQEMEYNEDGTEAKTPSMKHGEGPGTQQAGTSAASNIKGDLKDQEEDIAKEDVEYEDSEDDTLFSEDTLADDIELFFSEQEEGEEDEKKELDVDKKMGEKEGEESAEEDEDEEEEEEVEEAAAFTEEAENAVIEKLIDEMEELEEGPMTYKGEGPKVSAGKGTMSYDKEGPAPGMEAPDEKKASGPQEDTKGAGTDQAGTGPAEDQIPPRKDMHDQMVKPKNYSEDVDIFEGDLDLEAIEALGLEEKEWSGKDVPKKKEYHDEQSAVPGGPSPKKAGPEAEDWEEGQYYEESAIAESFEIFKEAIKDDKEKDDDDIIV